MFTIDNILQIHQINALITNQRICLFQFQAHKFQTDCLPYPKQVIKVIDSFMPQLAVKRNEKLQETMRVCIFF